MARRGEGMDPVDEAVGARIRIRRKMLGISQSELADSIGVSFQQVQKYERGTNRASASTLVHIAAALDCPAAALLGEEPTSPVEAELLGLLAEDGATQLLQSFCAIPDRETRQAVLAVAAGLSAGPVPKPKKDG